MKPTRPPPAAGLPGLLLLFLFLSLPGTGPLEAQGNRISLGYEYRSYLSSFEADPAFGGDVSPLSQGSLRLEYTRYLSGPLFASAGLSYLLHDDEAVFGGPLRYEAWDTEGRLGLQFDRLSVFGGFRAGRLGNIRVLAADGGGGLRWIPPSGSDDRWTASGGGGVGYFLLPFLEARAGVMFPVASSGPVTASPSAPLVPATRSVDLGSPTLSVSVSISVPFGRPRPMAGPDTPGLDRPPNPRPVSGEVVFVDPVDGPSRITAGFGDGRGHEGVDIDTGPGDPIYAAATGEVVRAGTEPRYGKVVELRHAGGYATVYAHLSAIEVGVGQTVDRGRRIGRAGTTGRATGTHLHFEVLVDGEHVDPTAIVPFR